MCRLYIKLDVLGKKKSNMIILPLKREQIYYGINNSKNNGLLKVKVLFDLYTSMSLVSDLSSVGAGVL